MLFMASANNHTEIVKLLLDAKADVNTAYNGMTPLFIASGKGYLEIVKLLLKAKADVNVTDNVGATSLYFASQNGHAEVVELLLSAGADVNAKAKVGGRGRYYSPLDVAEHNKHEQVIKLLKEYKMDPLLLLCSS